MILAYRILFFIACSITFKPLIFGAARMQLGTDKSRPSLEQMKKDVLKNRLFINAENDVPLQNDEEVQEAGFVICLLNSLKETGENAPQKNYEALNRKIFAYHRKNRPQRSEDLSREPLLKERNEQEEPSCCSIL